MIINKVIAADNYHHGTSSSHSHHAERILSGCDERGGEYEVLALHGEFTALY